MGYPVADWLPDFMQDKYWTWLWWADHMGHGLARYEDDPEFAPWLLDAIKASPPYPEGYLPETRRPGYYD